jgi:glutamine amidotransferase-like uncharacterized protein
VLRFPEGDNNDVGNPRFSFKNAGYEAKIGIFPGLTVGFQFPTMAVEFRMVEVMEMQEGRKLLFFIPCGRMAKL